MEVENEFEGNCKGHRPVHFERDSRFPVRDDFCVDLIHRQTGPAAVYLRGKGMKMKCPFRTITISEPFYAREGSATRVEFSECIEKECPYYGKTVLQHRPMGGFESVVMPVCRRIENER